ncbi:MAG: ATP-binding protein [Promethearchaeota archaeon]
MVRSDKKIELKRPSRIECNQGTINIGRIPKRGGRKFLLSLKDFEKHVFICGSTGTGKTNFLQNLLLNFSQHHKIPFFLVEFKGEYHFLQEKIEDLLVLWPGENFSINLFDPGRSNPIIHAERIFDILKSGKFLDDASGEFSPQMEKVLIEILVEACQDEKKRNWQGFETCCKKYLAKNNRKIPMLGQTLIGIKNRIRRFSVGPLKKLFEGNNSIKRDELFRYNILLDLSSIIKLGGEKQDAFFFLNLILKYLWDLNLSRGASNYSGVNHIIIIEDAQYFAPQNAMKKRKITTYLEDIALLQRGTGECLVTLATRPDISEEILANCGVLVAFKNHLERNYLSKLLNLETEKEDYFSLLEEGHCIVRVNSINEPFLLKVPFIQRKTLNSEIIKKNNINIQKKVIINRNKQNFKVLNENKSIITQEVVVLKNDHKEDLKNLKAKVLALFEMQRRN